LVNGSRSVHRLLPSCATLPRFCAGRRWFASEVTPTSPLRFSLGPDRLGASDQAEADAAFGAGVNRALWSWARELISSLR
jgi:hypothetical protein